MNVTLKIDDALCREARHRAVDEGLSLSAWIAGIVHKELAVPKRPSGLLAALSMKGGEERKFEIPRDPSGARDVTFR